MLVVTLFLGYDVTNLSDKTFRIILCYVDSMFRNAFVSDRTIEDRTALNSFYGMK